MSISASKTYNVIAFKDKEKMNNKIDSRGNKFEDSNYALRLSTHFEIVIKPF